MGLIFKEHLVLSLNKPQLVFLALAAALNWELCQVDVNHAFLNGDLEEEFYMELQKGYKIKRGYRTSANLVCKLGKSLYGLK